MKKKKFTYKLAPRMVEVEQTQASNKSKNFWPYGDFE